MFSLNIMGLKSVPHNVDKDAETAIRMCMYSVSIKRSPFSASRISASGRGTCFSTVLRFRLRVTKRVVSDRPRFDGSARTALRAWTRAASGHSSIRSGLGRSCVLVCVGPLCKREFRSSRSRRSTRFRPLAPVLSRLRASVSRGAIVRASLRESTHGGYIDTPLTGRAGYVMPDEGSGVNDDGRL